MERPAWILSAASKSATAFPYSERTESMRSTALLTIDRSPRRDTVEYDGRTPASSDLSAHVRVWLRSIHKPTSTSRAPRMRAHPTKEARPRFHPGRANTVALPVCASVCAVRRQSEAKQSGAHRHVCNAARQQRLHVDERVRVAKVRHDLHAAPRIVCTLFRIIPSSCN